MKKKLWRIWQAFLILSIPLNIVSLVICGCMLDSKSHIPLIVCGINILWLVWLMVCNAEKNEKKSHEDKEDDLTKYAS